MNAVRVPPRRVRGVLLPLLALALAAGGTAWLTTLPAGNGSGHAGVPAARTRLLDVRRALISHASGYPDAYGPLGAGPGHLVCPDTDTPLARSADSPAAGTAGAFAGDGPDPPCGGGPLAIGRLPRHASPDGRRRIFHHEPSQRFVYGVSTGHVNNPPGRAVRADRAGASIGSDAVAVIVDPGGAALSLATLAGARDPLELLRRVRSEVAGEAGAEAARALPHVFVTAAQLGEAARRRVAAWFVETATDAAGRSGPPSPFGADAATDAPGPWPDAGCPPDAPPEPLRWVGDRDRDRDGDGDGTESDGCAIPATIEGAPRERHWFVRDGWFRDIEIRRDEACRGDAAATCRLAIVRGPPGRADVPVGRPAGTGTDGAPITIALSPDGFALDPARRDE